MPKPKLTAEAVQNALLPDNNCKVLAFRKTLDAESLANFDGAVALDKKDLPAQKLRTLLIEAGFDQDVVPGVDAIHTHRSGTRPCRCHG